MKSFLSLLFLLLLVAGGSYGLLFTPTGNDLLLPYINRYIAQKVPETMSVQMMEFRLKPHNLEAKLRYNEQMDLHLFGPIDMMKKSFDLHYTVRAKALRRQKRLIPAKIDLGGDFKGTIQNLEVTGAGKIAGSKVDFRLKRENQVPKDIVVHMRKADLRTLQLIAGLKPYAAGEMDLNIEMPKLTDAADGAKVRMAIRNGRVDEKLLREDFNLTLPEDFRYTAQLEGAVHPKEAKLRGDLRTNIGNLDLPDIRLNPAKKSLKTPYTLKIPELARLDGLLPVAMQGALDLKGVLRYEKGLYLEGESGNLGGKLKFWLEKGALRAKMRQLHLKKVLYTLRYPLVAEGEVNGTVDYRLKQKRGEVEATMERVVLLPNQMTEILKKFGNIDLTKERYNHTRLDADIDHDLILFNLDAKSRHSRIQLKDAKLNSTTKQILAKFALRYKEKDFSGRIEGDIRHPKVVFDSSKYLKKRVEKEAKRLIEKRISEKTKEKLQKRLNKLGLEEINASRGVEEGVKGLIKGLFH